MATMLGQICFILLFALLQDGESVLFWLAAVGYGLTFGPVGALLPLLAMDTFKERFSSVYGIQTLFFIIPSIVGPVIAGLSFQFTGLYDNSFIATACIQGVGLVALQIMGSL